MLGGGGIWIGAVTGGGGGGTPGGSSTQLQYNNSGAFGGLPTTTFASSLLTIGDPLKLSSQTNLDIQTSAISGTGALIPAPVKPVIRLTGTVTTVVGIDNTGVLNGTTVEIQNNTGHTVTLFDQNAGQGTAAQRIITNYAVNPYPLLTGSSITAQYDTSVSRWKLINIPFGIITPGTQTFSGDKTFFDQITFNSGHVIFNDQVDSNNAFIFNDGFSYTGGSVGTLAHFVGDIDITSPHIYATTALGVGTITPTVPLDVVGDAHISADLTADIGYFNYIGVHRSTQPTAAVDILSSPITVSAPVTPTGVTNLESLIGPPTSDTAAQAAPQTVGVMSATAIETPPTGSYTENGSTYDFKVVHYYLLPTVGTFYTPAVAIGSFTDGFNAGVAATGIISLSGVPPDGNTVDVGDGASTISFTYTSTPSAGTDIDTSSADLTVITANTATVIQANLSITAVASGTDCNLTNNSLGVIGNVTITTTDPGDVSVSGMSGGVDPSNQSFSIDLTWTAFSNGGGYTGTKFGRQINGGGYTWYDAAAIGASGSATDDGSGSPFNWGSTSAPAGTSPDYIANGSTYSFNTFSQGTSPSGQHYYIAGSDFPSFVDSTDGAPFSIDLINPNSVPVSFQETSPGSTTYLVPSSSTSNIFTNTAGSGAITPNAYGYIPDGTGTTPNYYRVTTERVFDGNVFYSAPSAWSTPNLDDATFPWYSTITWAAVTGATNYLIEYSPDGVTATRTLVLGNVITYSDDNLSPWVNSAGPHTPTSYTPPAERIEGNWTSSSPYARVYKITGVQFATNVLNNVGNQVGIEVWSPNGNYAILGTGAFNFDYAGGSFNGGNFLGGMNLESTTDINIFATTDVDFKLSGVEKMKLDGVGLHLSTSLSLPITSKSADYTLTTNDYTVILSTGTHTFTLPTAVGNSGIVFFAKNRGTVLTLAAFSGQTIDGSSTKVVTSGMTVQSDGSNFIIVSQF